MRWHGFSGFKYYVSAAIALVGLSAASTLLTDRVSLAQQPTVETTVTVSDDQVADKLELAEKILEETLGNDHPKLREVRARLDQARTQARKAAQAAGKAEAAKRVIVQNLSSAPFTVTGDFETTSDVVTENVVGNQAVVVRRTADGQEIREVLATGPKEVRGFSLFGNVKQNSELQKAIEKYRDKDAEGKDKVEAKWAIDAVLGKQFDDDMDQRAKQVAELEKKVTALKEQIVKRKEAKKKIIDLRFEVLMNEMEGLGFPSSGPQPGPAFFNAINSPAAFRSLSVPGAPIAPAAPVPPVAPTAPVAPPAPAPEK